jgi:hypothetical protein
LPALNIFCVKEQNITVKVKFIKAGNLQNSMEELENIVKSDFEYNSRLFMRSALSFSAGFAARLATGTEYGLQAPIAAGVLAAGLKKVVPNTDIPDRIISLGPVTVAYCAGNICANLSLYLIKN